MPQIHFNGKTYNDIAEMPATEREMYDQLMSVMRDEDGNGVPDIFEGDVVSNIIGVIKKSGYGDSQGITALDQMPPEMRARLSKGIAMLQEFGLLSEMPDLSHVSQAPSWEDAEIRPSKPIIQSPSAIQEDSGPRRLLLVAILAAVGICAVGVALAVYSGL